MSRKTTLAVAAILSILAGGTAIAQGTKADTTGKKKATTATTKGTKTGAMKKSASSGMKKAPAKGMKKGTMKKDSTAKKP